jgi:hypothetical protein
MGYFIYFLKNLILFEWSDYFSLFYFYRQLFCLRTTQNALLQELDQTIQNMRTIRTKDAKIVSFKSNSNPQPTPKHNIAPIVWWIPFIQVWFSISIPEKMWS